MKDFLPYSDNTSGGPLQNGAMFLVFILLLPLYPVLWIIYELRRQYSLLVRGFWVLRLGRDNFEYQERRSGKIERLTIYGEMLATGRSVVYLPGEESWRQEVPEWAQNRREQIIARIKSILGTRKYEYVT